MNKSKFLSTWFELKFRRMLKWKLNREFLCNYRLQFRNNSVNYNSLLRVAIRPVYLTQDCAFGRRRQEWSIGDWGHWCTLLDFGRALREILPTLCRLRHWPTLGWNRRRKEPPLRPERRHRAPPNHGVSPECPCRRSTKLVNKIKTAPQI